MPHLWPDLLEEVNGLDVSHIKTRPRHPVMPGAVEVAPVVAVVEEDDAEESEAEVEETTTNGRRSSHCGYHDHQHDHDHL